MPILPHQVKAITTTLAGVVLGLGHIPNPFHRFTPIEFGFARARASAMPVDGMDVRSTMPRKMNQGPSGSCEANAGSKGLVGALAKKGISLGFVPSQADLYRLARSIDRLRDTGSTAQPLQDVGTEGSSIISVFQQFGVRPMGPRPADGRFSDVDPANMNAEISLGDAEQDAKFRFNGAYSILDRTQPTIADALMQAIAVFGPIPVASFVDSRFMQYTIGSAPIDENINYQDPQGGGHKVVCAGWRWFLGGKQVTATTPGAVRLWIIDNSWGADDGWGDGDGACLATDGWVAQTDEREAYDVSEAA